MRRLGSVGAVASPRSPRIERGIRLAAGRSGARCSAEARTRRLGFVALMGLGVLVLMLGGCANLSRRDAAAADFAEPMTQARMEQLFSAEVDAIVGPTGAIETRVDGIQIVLLSDPEADRMRIVAPIAQTSQVDPRMLAILLEANFHRTRDARYATSQGVIYAVFLHPISSLSPDLLSSGFAQVLSLAKTFGRTFDSGALEPAAERAAQGD